MYFLLFFLIILFSRYGFKKIEKQFFSSNQSLLGLVTSTLSSNSDNTQKDTTNKSNTANTAASDDPEIAAKQTVVDKLKAELESMNKEAEKYNNPSDYVKHSKIKRKMIPMERRLEEENAALSKLKLNSSAKPSSSSETEKQKEQANKSTTVEPVQEKGSNQRTLRLIYNAMRFVVSQI